MLKITYCSVVIDLSGRPLFEYWLWPSAGMVLAVPHSFKNGLQISMWEV